jgi:tetratricopeptide (TPR) repeat protein
METEIIERSRQYINEGKYEKAQIILRRALEEVPNRAQVLELCGDLAVKLGRISEAINRYEHAFENYTNNGQYAEGIICLEKILNLDEMNDGVLLRLVDLYHFYGLRNVGIKRLIDFASRALKKKDEALFVSALRKVVEFQPKNLPLRLSLAKLLFSVNRNREAEDELIKLRSLATEVNDEAILNEIENLLPRTDGGDELDPKSRIELGNLLYEIGSKDEALVEFKKAADDLIHEGKYEDAINVLNRILEIDPNNNEALAKLKELKPGAKAEERVEVESPSKPEEVSTIDLQITEEEVKSEKPTPPIEETISEIQSDLEILADLSKQIEGITPITEKEPAPTVEPVSEGKPAEETPVEQEPEKKVAEVPPIEGRLADIEFLLKEAEAAPPTPRNFEVAKQFDEFRTNITWEVEDTKKKIALAKMAVDSGLYEVALSYLEEEKEKKEFWPTSLEIIGEALIKLGRYNDAIKTLGPIILLEDIPEDKKIELRYLLASGYEGLGDFENAMREIERIMEINPDYRDIKEIYTLLGGKIEVTEEEPKPVVEEEIKEVKEVVEEGMATESAFEPGPDLEEVQIEKEAQIIIEESPRELIEEPPKELKETSVEEPIIEEGFIIKEERSEEKIDFDEKGENITFI